MKDWKGNAVDIHRTMGSRNYATSERIEHDYYATEPKALEWLLKYEKFNDVWECACGEGSLSAVLKTHNILKRESDLILRNYKCEEFNFLSMNNTIWDGDIITNPPFKHSFEFINKALFVLEKNKKLALFLPIRYLEGVARGHIYTTEPPYCVYIPIRRFNVAVNGCFENLGGSALSFCWFVWIKGFKGETKLQWIKN